MFDLCVIGAGCIGSAAGRYGSQWGRVCLIGPKEPQERIVTDNRDIFGAHYDEGRITRSSDEDIVWSTFAKESIARYRELERLSGVHFYNEVGYIICGPGKSDFMKENIQCAKDHSVHYNYLTNTNLKEHFPFLNFSKSDEAIYESRDAGYISPRRIIEAEIKVAKSNGCEIIYDVVLEIERCVRDGRYVMSVKTDDGKQIYADKVLIANGAFTAFRKLLPSDLRVDVLLHPITIARVEISAEDYHKIRTMPSISYSGKGAKDWRSKFVRLSDNTVRFYMLPPVKYPNGKYSIKLGHYLEDYPTTLNDADDVKRWFCGNGDLKMIQDIVTIIQDIVKGIKVLSYQGDCCVIVRTPSQRPYIGQIHEQLGVALGGNGCSAKSGDEIGRIAATMIMKNKWDSSLPKELFKVRFKTDISKL